MKKILYFLIVYNSILVFFYFIMAINSFNIKLNLEFDTGPIVIVLGNLLIGLILTGYLSKKHKKDEIELDHCIKDISEILLFVKELKKDVYSLKESYSESLKREIISKNTIVEELINMLESHSLINLEELASIKNIYRQFEVTLTEKENINEKWFDKLLKLHRHLLKLKNNVIKKYRNT